MPHVPEKQRNLTCRGRCWSMTQALEKVSGQERGVPKRSGPRFSGYLPGFSCVPDSVFLETLLHPSNKFSLSCFHLDFCPLQSKRSSDDCNGPDPGMVCFQSFLSVYHKGGQNAVSPLNCVSRANGVCDFGRLRVLQRPVCSAIAAIHCVRPSVTTLEDCATTDSKPTSLSI